MTLATLSWPARRRQLQRALLGAIALAVILVLVLELDLFARECGTVACNAGVDLGATLVALLAGLAVFRVVKRLRLVHRYLSLIRDHPGRLLDTVPDDLDPDAIAAPTDRYEAIADDLKESRGPHVVTGGPGTGKTTFLIGLARYLARHGAVPVVVPLRGVITPPDYRGLAKARFLALIDSHLGDEGDGDRLWRQLCRAGLIVILADGLDEAGAADGTLDADQVGDADEDELPPTVVTSRARPLPAEVRAQAFALDGLPEHCVVDELSKVAPVGGADRPSQSQVEDVVRSAGVAGTPFYLDVARDVLSLGPLPLPSAGDSARVLLLDRYVKAIIAGELRRGAELDEHQRKDAVDLLGLLAHVMLLRELPSLEVAYLRDPAGTLLAGYREPDFTPLHGLSAAKRLRLVEVIDAGGQPVLRFRHPIMQAYFASRVLGEERVDAPVLLWEEAIRRPTTESLLAMRLHAARVGDQTPVREMVQALLDRAEDHPREALRLEFAAAAGHAIGNAGLRNLAETACRRGEDAWESGQPATRTAALRALSALHQPCGHEALLRLAAASRYDVEWEAVELITRDGEDAFRSLEGTIRAAVERAEVADPDGMDTEQLKAIAKALPTLVETVVAAGDAATAADARELLARLSAAVLAAAAQGHGIGAEASLAQGHRQAARTPRDPDADRLVIDLLDVPPRFFYSRIVALQALARRCAALVAAGVPAADPRVSAMRTRIEASTRDPHPFVAEAAELCLLAVRDGNATPYVWHDESVVVRRWGVDLEKRTSRLLADVVLVLNMNEQHFGDDDAARVRLRKTQEKVGTDDRVPACLSTHRTRDNLLSGSPDPCPKGCGFHLCPYDPARGRGAHRGLSRAFVRRQSQLALRGAPPWQPQIGRFALRSFWRAIAERTDR